MQTNREDVGIAIRSAFLSKGTKQKFSLFALIFFSILLIFFDTINSKPLNIIRSLIKDAVYVSSVAISSPGRGIQFFLDGASSLTNLRKDNTLLLEENLTLKDKISTNSYLELENTQLRKLIDDSGNTISNLISARVMLEQNSPYLNSFVLNSGSNKGIKNGMAVMNGKNFIGRIVDVNYFSSRVLLVNDLNSKIAVIIEPSGNQAILNGHGKNNPTLEFLPKNFAINVGDIVFTSGKENLFKPGIPIGEVLSSKKREILLYSDMDQISYVNIQYTKKDKTE